MSRRQLFACILTAFVMMPESGALKTPGPGMYEPLQEFKKRGLTFSAHSIEKALKSTSDAYPVRITLANDGSTPLTFLMWGSPFEETISNRIVSSEPKTSSYLGYIVNRKPGTLPETALTTVQPGTEIAVTVDLNELMAFHEKRHYEVFVNFTLLMFDTHTMPHQDKLTAENSIQQMMSTTLEVEVESVRTKKEVQQRFAKLGSGGCDNDQLEIIDAATLDATEMTAEAQYNILMSARSATQSESDNQDMYELWLGEDWQCPDYDRFYLAERFDHMMHSVFRWYMQGGTGYIPDCATCLARLTSRYNSVYAYVYPFDASKRVYFCGAFWRAPSGPLARDSQPGTLIHELSHFDDSFDTNDFAYSTGPIQDLARTRTCDARHNADNIEAFAEYVWCPNGYCR